MQKYYSLEAGDVCWITIYNNYDLTEVGVYYELSGMDASSILMYTADAITVSSSTSLAAFNSTGAVNMTAVGDTVSFIMINIGLETTSFQILYGSAVMSSLKVIMLVFTAIAVTLL